MKRVFVLGNGQSRVGVDLEKLREHGKIYGCNAIYRDHPKLCDHIIGVSPEMFEELSQWHNNGKESPKIYGINDISKWNYICDGDAKDEVPEGLKIYRVWRGGNIKKGGRIKINDFSNARGSGCSAVVLAAESGIKNVVIMAFDIVGARQWEMETPSRLQNNIYKNTKNYPYRDSMKAYLKYEWMFQLRQTFKKFSNTNFYFINRREYLEGNPFLRWYFDQPNIKCGIYADLQRWITGYRDDIKWRKL